eukprot:gnl/TRDRNA2_/TRDRNA2_39092_c0_seq2.p2 gnl/TRDRNA2_/TRDRNA2_39092_c0~~gnl/TRDRNA2_/TRDRNA2_39092_c0_seq2.p2  ORF type:complete len:168 (+),score=25.38 gnl/TRDRNA2_/TRDRNA2_39092_c0_seq2:128-631(+)
MPSVLPEIGVSPSVQHLHYAHLGPAAAFLPAAPKGLRAVATVGAATPDVEARRIDRAVAFLWPAEFADMKPIGALEPPGWHGNPAETASRRHSTAFLERMPYNRGHNMFGPGGTRGRWEAEKGEVRWVAEMAEQESRTISRAEAILAARLAKSAQDSDLKKQPIFVT